MFKYYFSAFFLFGIYFSVAQNNLTLSGLVLDVNSQLPLESVTVYVSNAKDSTVVEFTNTSESGFFKISTKKTDKPVFLKVSCVGYQSYIEELKGIYENKDFGKLYLSQIATELAGVVVKSEAPPIRIKKDTLEFNASSFKVRPDSNIELLLKQLPGFQVDNDGKITVNGKDVTQFLVNGKEFFDRNGAIALKNLPAEIISKIQVSDYKTKKEEVSKQESSSENSTINLIIDEKKNKGFFSKFLGGYGSNDRYESSFVINLFNNKRKISFLASSNNINASGFSMDEVFDSMGGGRNTTSRGGGRGFGSRGITVTKLAGINYTDQWFKNFDTTGSYSFSNNENENKSASKQINFLPTGNFSIESNAITRDENTDHKFNLELEYKINPSTRIYFTPRISQSNTNSNSTASSISKDENDALLNESSSKTFREGNATNMGNTLNFNKIFQKKSRNLNLIFNSSNSLNQSVGLSESKTVFYEGGKPIDKRNQKNNNENTTDIYSAEIEFTEPITDSLRVRIGTDFDWQNEIKDTRTFDFDSSLETYTTINSLLSNYVRSKQNKITPKLGFSFEKNKFIFNINSSIAFISFNNNSLYINNLQNFNQKYSLPYGRAQITYKFQKSKFMTFNYDYVNTLPSYSQLLPVENLANPLNTVIGNPNLRPNEKQSIAFNFRNFDLRTRSGYTLFLKTEYYSSEIVSISVYDSSRKRNTTYENISGTYTSSLGGSWNQSIKLNTHVIRYGLGINANYSLDKGFTNAVLYAAKSLAFTPRIYLNYDYGELITISPSYNLSYSETNYTNYTTNASSNVVHRLNLQTTSYFPINWIFGNDFGYNYNSRIANGFKKDFYLWNTSLSYSFYNKNMIAKVKVYDLLNQNQSFSRTISATTIRDEENTILKRYAMFSLTYRLQDFSAMKKMSNQMRKKERNAEIEM